MPFKQFNNLLGRLTDSSKLQPLYPLNPVPLSKEEPPKPMFDTIKTKIMKTGSSLAQMSSHAPSSGDIDSKIIMKGQESLPENIKRNYIKFQTNIHEPVYLKAGMRDKILYGITIAGTLYCAAECLIFMWKHRNHK